MLGIALVGLAMAQPRWVRIDDQGQCQVTHPPRHRIEEASDTLKRREDLAAVEDATKKRAVDALLASACANRTPAQCEAIRAKVGVDTVIDHERGLVCTAALVASDVVADPDGRETHQATIRQLAGEAAAQLAGAPVGSVTARWANGCGAGNAGASLTSALRAGLVGQGTMVTDGVGDRLVARLSPGDPVTVELWRYPPSGDGHLLGARKISGGWLKLYGATGDQCHSDAALGLMGGQRAGSGGLTVSLNLDVPGALCPAGHAKAVVRPSDAAHVQVWSVGRSGEAWLAWSSQSDPAVGGVLNRRVTLDFEAAYVPALGEETLLVVAAPVGVTLPPGEPGCRVSRLRGVPPEAALSAAPFTVLPPGRDQCPAVGGSGGLSWADYQSAPPCQ